MCDNGTATQPPRTKTDALSALSTRESDSGMPDTGSATQTCTACEELAQILSPTITEVMLAMICLSVCWFVLNGGHGASYEFGWIHGDWFFFLSFSLYWQSVVTVHRWQNPLSKSFIDVIRYLHVRKFVFFCFVLIYDHRWYDRRWIDI